MRISRDYFTSARENRKTLLPSSKTMKNYGDRIRLRFDKLLHNSVVYGWDRDKGRPAQLDVRAANVKEWQTRMALLCQNVEQHANLDLPIFIKFRSLLSKQGVLLNNVTVCESYTIFGRKTWLSSDIEGNELLDPTFISFWKDRLYKNGGDAFVAVKCSLPSFAIRIVSDLQILFVDVKIAHMNIVVGICYRALEFGRLLVSSLAAYLN